MSDRALTEILDEIIDADRVSLPVRPKVARQLLDGTGRVDTSGELKLLIEQDPALVCSLFCAANSSFFKGLKQTCSIEDAITRLGHEKTVHILQEACRQGAEICRNGLAARYLPGFWQHATGSAMGSRWLATRCGYQGLAQQAYLSGLLHDIGKLFLVASLDRIASDDSVSIPLSDQIILEVLQTMHVEQGVRLIHQWNLPEIFLLVVNNHHDIDSGCQDVIVSLVKLANKGCHKVGLGWEQDRSLVLPTTAEAQFLGISEIALAEYEIMLEDNFLSEPQRLPQTGERRSPAEVSTI